MRPLASMLVELLPIEAWLLVFAGYQGVSVDRAAVPFWALLAAMALAWWIARRARDASQRKAFAAGVVPFIVAYFVLLRVSPSAYGDQRGFFDLSWLGALAGDFATSSHREDALFGLLLLLMLIWWRGTALGVDLESHSGNLRRFTLFMGGLLLALVGAAAAKPATQDALSAALTLILLAEVFVGLLDAALARIAEVRREGAGSGANEAPWVRTSLALAAGVIGIALLVSLVFNFNSFLALLAYMGPVGGFISFALTWLVTGFANLFGKLLSGIVLPFHIREALPHLAPLLPLPQGCHVVNGATVCPQQSHSNGLLDFISHVLIIITALVIVAIIAAVIRSAPRRRRADETGANEEREALDARRLFAAQLRGLFGRRGRRERQVEEALPRGSVRYIYREVLRTAHGNGLDRHPDETPDEYAARLGKTAPIAMFSTVEGDDLLALNDAYDDARYAIREPDQRERDKIQAGATRLMRLFRGQERGRR